MNGGFIAPEVERYLDAHVPPRDALLARLEAQAARERIPICGPQVGQLLSVVAAHAVRALEVGTAIGYSTIWLGRAIAPRGGTLETIELSADRAGQARRNLAEAALDGKVQVIEGAALDVLARLPGPYDLIFVDAVKAEYPAYLEHARRLLALGGWLIVDNVLLSGTVAGLPGGWSSDDRAGVAAFTRALLADPAFVSEIVPIRDGVSLSTRR